MRVEEGGFRQGSHVAAVGSKAYLTSKCVDSVLS